MTEPSAGDQVDDTDLYGPAATADAEDAGGDWGGGDEEEYYEADGTAEAEPLAKTANVDGEAVEGEAVEGEAVEGEAAEAAVEGAQGAAEDDDHTISVVEVTEETAMFNKAMDAGDSVMVAPDGEAVKEGYTAPPDTNVSAEIVLIMTSLGSVRRMHFASKRLQHFLNCKAVVYYVIDINRDASSGADLCDEELLEKWKAENFLLIDEEATEATGTTAIKIPQVLIDGVPVGNETAFQNLEEDGDLDWLLSRAACPSCLNEKSSSLLVCPSCNTSFQTLIPEDKLYEGAVQQVYRGQACSRGEAFEHQTLTPPPPSQPA